MKKLLLFYIFFSFFTTDCFSQDEFTSPYQTLKYCKENLHEGKEYKKNIAKTFAGSQDEKTKIALARKFFKIIKSHNLFIKLDNVPKADGYLDSISHEPIYYPFASADWIYLEKIGDDWLFSKETVNSIEDFYNESKIIQAMSFQDDLPQTKFLGLKAWQWLGFLVIILISMIFYKIFAILFHVILKKIFSRYKYQYIFEKYIGPISKPISLFAVLSLILLAIGLLQLPISMSYYIRYFLKIALLVFLTIIVFRSCNVLGAILGKLAARTESTVDDQLVPLLIKVLKVVVVIMGGIYIVKAFGWSITPLVAGASIGGIAIAMSAQDTLRNLFGSVTMFTDQPFEVGDWIVFKGGEGSVEEVGIRSTRIRTFYDSLISVPNGELSNAVIDNMGRREFRRYVTRIGVTYDTHPDAIDAFVAGLRQLVEDHPHTRDYYQIHLNDFAASSIEILFYVFFKVPDWTAELEARHELISDIIRLAKTLNVRFAFNTQTLHIEEMPGQSTLTPSYTQTPESLSEKNQAFLEQNRAKYKK